MVSSGKYRGPAVNRSGFGDISCLTDVGTLRLLDACMDLRTSSVTTLEGLEEVTGTLTLNEGILSLGSTLKQIGGGLYILDCPLLTSLGVLEELGSLHVGSAPLMELPDLGVDFVYVYRGSDVLDVSYSEFRNGLRQFKYGSMEECMELLPNAWDVQKSVLKYRLKEDSRAK
jgi:hypothetical protein